MISRKKEERMNEAREGKKEIKKIKKKSPICGPRARIVKFMYHSEKVFALDFL